MDPQIFVQKSNFFLFCLVILLSLVFMFKIKRSRKLNLPPSPPKLPIIGNLHQISAFPYRSFRTLSEQYGPLMLLHLGHVPTLVVSTLAIAKEINENHDVVFAGRPTLTGAKIVFNGCLGMAFGPYSDHVRETKKLCVLQLLSQKRVQQFHFIRKEEVGKFLEKIRILSINGSAFSISDMFLSVAHNILSRSAFGCLYENEDGKYKSFGEVASKTFYLLAKFCFKDFLPILGWLDHLTGFIQNLKNTSKELNDFLDRTIEDRLALMNDHDDEKLEDKKYLVDILLYLQKEGIELDLSKDSLKTILKVMFIGGIDSIAVTMEWMMAQLMKNPRIRMKAQEEVRRVVGKKSEITQADINKMKYCKCIVKETIRLHSSAMMIRETSTDIKLQGYDIPPKTRVIINTWAIQRDPNLWDRPEEFLPERFLNSCDIDNDDCSKLLAFSFGIGRRICPGMSYSYAEIEYVLANFLFWFDWELPNGASEMDLDMSEVFTFSISKRIPLWVVANAHFPQV